MLSQVFRSFFANAAILLCLTTLFWAGNFVIGRAVTGIFPPIALAWYRWTLAFLIVLPFTLPYVMKDWPIIKKNLPTLILLSILGVGSFNTLSYIGLNHTTAINAFILQSAAPVMIAAIAFLTFKDRVTILQSTGIVLSLAGVLLVLAKADLEILRNLTFNIGDIWVFAAVACWSFYTVFLRWRPEIHWASFAGVSFGVGALFITPFFVWEHYNIAQAKFDTESILAVGYVCIFPSILSYIFYNRGVELIGPNRAGAYLHMGVFFGTILSILLLNEELLMFHLAGMILILFGVALASKKPREASMEASRE